MIFALGEQHRLRIRDGKGTTELESALVFGYDMEVQVGIRIAEGAQVDLVAAPQFLHCTGGPGQIPGEGGQLLRPALAQLLPVVLQRQGAAALVGLILKR